MKISRTFLFITLIAGLISACSHQEKKIHRDIASLAAAGGMEGIWFLQGSSSTRGPYNGELEFRKSHDGTYDVVRVATYINYFFDGLRVQEVWTGKAVVSGDMITLTYDLKQGDLIYRLNGQRREDENLKVPISVIARMKPTTAGPAARFTDKKFSDYAEWITTRRPLEEKPLWVSQRRYENAKGKEIPSAVRKDIQNFKRSTAFDKSPLLKDFKAKKEFKNEEPWVIVDTTDYEFYKKNKDIIRLVNKITDDINITEAAVKRNAYVPSLTEKAQGYERNISRWHFNEANLIVPSLLDGQGRFVRHQVDKDAAFLTGMYLASQVMRYQATKDKEALANIHRSLQGIINLIEISGENVPVAASITAKQVPEEDLKGWNSAAGSFPDLVWLRPEGRDSLVGVLHGLLWARVIFPELNKELSPRTEAAIKKLAKASKSVADETDRNLIFGLAAAWAKDAESERAFQPVVLQQEPFYWNGVADWKASSLNLVTQMSYVLVNDLLGQVAARDQWREKIINNWMTFEPAHRPLHAFAAYGFSFRHQIRGQRFVASSSSQQFEESLDQAIWGLKEIPFPRPSLQVRIDRSLSSEWVPSPLPNNFWEDPKQKRNNALQSLYSYPAYEVQAFSSKFIWTEPAFSYQASHEKGVENPGVDYLYAYWLAKYSGVKDVK